MNMNCFVVGTNDMARASAFYDRLFERYGLTRMQTSDRMTYWLGADFAFAAAVPFDKRPATVGNGTMVGFTVETADDVCRLHDLAVALGGTCDGAPGPRGPRFSAYVRDLDGNKLCFSA